MAGPPPPPPGPFRLPMMAPFVPRRLHPWLYLLIACGFQLGGGMYLGALNEIIGERVLMREDVQMCLYATLIGMSFYFPLLFRMKFRFTNKQLLTTAAVVMLGCNLVAPHITNLPLLWAVCFLCGMAKIQGTFEVMSNIQLWMTPKRDFTIFFPILQCVILCMMHVSDLLTVHFLTELHWTFMHWFIAAYMLCILLFVTICVRPFRFMKPMPLFGIDFLGMLLWATFAFLVSAMLCYGDWLDWTHSPVFLQLLAAAAVTLVIAIGRMLHIRHPYLEPKMWVYRQLTPVLLLITLVELLLSSEHVLEEIFYEEVMDYAESVTMLLDWVAIAGTIAGCAFSWVWMNRMRQSYIRLCSIALIALSGYFITFYMGVSSDVSLIQIALPVLLRSLAYGMFCAAFFVWLEEIMTFQHFFQALAVFNVLHAVVGGVLGAAVYGTAFSHLVSDNISRYEPSLNLVTLTREHVNVPAFMEAFVTDMMEVSLRQIYGALSFASLALLALFLLYDTPVRSTYKHIPSWPGVARQVKKSLRG